jgi:hypothetical protein
MHRSADSALACLLYCSRCALRDDDSELSDGAKEELAERNCHKMLTDELREVAIRRVSKEELQVAHIVRLLKSRRQEEDDISTSVAALRTVVANVESEVRRTVRCLRLFS